MKYLLGEKLHFDWKIVTITIVSTLLLMVDYYHKITPQKYWDRIILYLLIPLSAVLVLAIIGIFGWALHRGQFDDLQREGERILDESEAG